MEINDNYYLSLHNVAKEMENQFDFIDCSIFFLSASKYITFKQNIKSERSLIGYKVIDTEFQFGNLSLLSYSVFLCIDIYRMRYQNPDKFQFKFSAIETVPPLEIVVGIGESLMFLVKWPRC